LGDGTGGHLSEGSLSVSECDMSSECEGYDAAAAAAGDDDLLLELAALVGEGEGESRGFAEVLWGFGGRGLVFW